MAGLTLAELTAGRRAAGGMRPLRLLQLAMAAAALAVHCAVVVAAATEPERQHAL